MQANTDLLDICSDQIIKIKDDLTTLEVDTSNNQGYEYMYYYFWYGCGEDYDSATFELYDTNDLNTKLNDWIKPDRGDLKWDGTDSDAADFNARLKVKNSAGNENFHDFTVDVLTFNSACVYTAAQTSHQVRVGETITFNHPVLSDINVDDVHTEQPVQISAQNGASTGWIVDSGTAFTFTPTDNALHYDTYTIHFSATDDNSANGSEGPLTCTLDITVEVLWQNECPQWKVPFANGETFAIKSNEDFPIDIDKTDADDTNFTTSIQIDSVFCSNTDKCNLSGTTVTFESPNQEGVFPVIIKTEDSGADGKDSVCEITKKFTLIVQAGNKQPNFDSHTVSVSDYEDNTATVELFGCTDPDSWDSLTYTLKIDGSGTLPSCLSFNDTPNGDNKLILTYTDCTTPTTYSGELKCEDDNLHSYDNNKQSSIDTFDIIVLPVNEPPVCTDLAPASYTTHETEIRIPFGSQFTDPDDTVFYYSFVQEPGFLEIDGQEIVIFTKDNQYPCATGSNTLVFNVILEVLDDNSVNDLANGQQSCQINLDLTLTALNLPPEFKVVPDAAYNLDNDGRTETYLFEFADEDVRDTIQFSVELVGGSLPSFISVTNTATSATVQATLELWNVNQVGVWNFRGFINDQNSFNLPTFEEEFFFSLNIDGVNHSVKFVEAIEYFEMTVGETYQVNAPQHEDEDFNDNFEYKVLKDPYNWITSSGTSDIIYINPIEDEHSGTYTLGFQIKDSNSGQCSCGKSKAKTFFDFTVYARDGSLLNNGNSEEEEEVEIATSLEDLLGYTVKLTSQAAPVPKIVRIDTQGIVTVVFDQELLVLPEIEKFINRQILSITLLPSYDGIYDPEEMLQSWECTAFSAQSMTLKLDLKQTLKISSFSDMDRLQIQFLVPYYFFASESQKTVAKGTTIRSQIPPQQPKNSAFGSMASASGSLNSASKLMVAVQFGINVILSASLNMIWSLMNTMQIMVHLPLMNLSFPQNAQSISEIFLSLANFDVVPHGYLNTKTFDFDQSLKIKDVRFDLMGYGETNFILNAGTSFWLILGWFGLAVFTIIITFINTSSTKFDNFRVRLNKIVFFQLIIRIYLECYLELLVCSLINIKNLNWHLDGERLSSLFSCFSFFVLSISPQIMHYLLTSNQRVIMLSKPLKERFGDLYEGFKCEQKHCLQFPYFFLLRRLVLAYTVIFLAEYLFLQISLTFICSTALIIYFIHFKPYRDMFMNQIELFNEFTILMLVYFLWGFTDNVSDPELKWNFGMLYSVIIFFSLLINIGSLTYQTLKKPCKKKFKGKCLMKKNKIPQKQYIKDHNTTLADLLPSFGEISAQPTKKNSRKTKTKKEIESHSINQTEVVSKLSFKKFGPRKTLKAKANPLEDTQNIEQIQKNLKPLEYQPQKSLQVTQNKSKRKTLKSNLSQVENSQPVFKKRESLKKTEKLFIKKQILNAQQSHSLVGRPKANSFSVSRKREKNMRNRIKEKKLQVLEDIEAQKKNEFKDGTIDFNQLKK